MDKDALPTAHMWVERSFVKNKDTVSIVQTVDGSEAVYRRSGFNEFGDVVAHVELPPQPKDEYPPIKKWDEQGLQRSIGKLNNFAAYCRRRGAQVYLSFPPMPRSRYNGSRDCLNQLRQMLDCDLHIARIDDPADYLFENDQFFDSFYHLSGDAITDRTRRLGASLDAIEMAQGRRRGRLR